MQVRPTPDEEHNVACERAAQADCQCYCHGAGHQHDLVERAASCSNGSDFNSLSLNLEQVFGGFHTNNRDVRTATRSSRHVPTANEIARLSLRVGQGATWFETLLVDEGLHAAFIVVANASLAVNSQIRDQRRNFVNGITRRAIDVVGSNAPAHTVVESHVWCSIVAEYLMPAPTLGATSTAARPPSYICYPRQSKGGVSSSLPLVRQDGLNHVISEVGAATTLHPFDKAQLLCLVGAATCPDLWHHAAVVRYCLEPFIKLQHWPPQGTTQLVDAPNFKDLARRWRRKGNW